VTGEAQSRGELFHGWKLVGALSVTLFFAAGGAMYVFPVFVGSFQEEFGWSMTQISIGAAVFAIVMGFSNPIVGVLFSRFGARKTMLVAACLLALCVATSLAALIRPERHHAEFVTAEQMGWGPRSGIPGQADGDPQRLFSSGS
jgi:MFS family permease